jgi:hypothetical protein
MIKERPAKQDLRLEANSVASKPKAEVAAIKAIAFIAATS